MLIFIRLKRTVQHRKKNKQKRVFPQFKLNSIVEKFIGHWRTLEPNSVILFELFKKQYLFQKL
jgi:hypothetical protein